MLSRRGMVKLSSVLVCGCSPAPSPISLLRSVHVCPGHPKSVWFFGIFWEKFQKQKFSCPGTRAGEGELIKGKS